MIEEFTDRLKKHAKRKEKLYDGINSALDPDQGIQRWMMYLSEEVGEVASSVNRDRFALAKEECIDVAHVAMLMYIALSQKEKTNTYDVKEIK